MIKDKMTPKERMTAYLNGEEIDRLPCIPMTGVTAADFIGVTTKEYYHSHELMAKLEIEMFKKFNHDSVGVGLGLHGIGEAFGTILEYPTMGTAYVKKPIINSFDEVKTLKPIDPMNDGNINIRLKALPIIIDSLGKYVDVGLDMPAPFSAAAAVIGTEKMLRGMIKNPEGVHELLEVVTDSMITIIDSISSMDVGISLCDPVASITIMSEKRYEQFAKPYTKKIVEYMKNKTGKGTCLHICGRSKEIWTHMVDTGIASLSIDNVEDLREAKELVGNKVLLIGNVNPVDVMKNGTREDVATEAKMCIEKAYDNPKGFILSTGCQIPIGAPVENIEALMEAASLYNQIKNSGVK